MKKNGFTLIELIATFALLGMLATITITISVRKINETKEKARDTMFKSIELAAKKYVSDYEEELTQFKNNDNIYISLQTLVEKEYFTESLVDPTTKKGIPLSNEVYIVREENGEITSLYNINQRKEPKLTLIGSYNEYVEEGKEYIEKGVNAISSEGTDLSSNVTITGTVDTESPNIYKITYELDNVKITRNVIVFSKNLTTKEFYKFTIDLDGGIDSKDYQTKYEGGSIVELEVPTKEGYEFNGWNIKGKGAIIEGNTLTMGSAATTVTATWEELVAYGDGDTYIANLLAKESKLNNGLVQTYATVNGKQVDAGIRYAGATANVKNKVYFNCAETDGTNAYGSENYNYESSCEIWRIIGVFDTKSTDSETEDAVPRIKIVRDEVLSTRMEWDTGKYAVQYLNQWGETTLASNDTTVHNGASIKQYLNGNYYNSLTSIAKGQISNALWYTGAVTKDTASGVYEDERSDATGTSNTVNYTTKWSGLIGLIYPSDFGYAGTNCGSYTISNYDKSDSCGKTSNWLTPASEVYWTISPNASSNNAAWIVNSGGYAVGYYFVYDSHYVRPSAYLSSNVQIIGGDGSTVPYKLK